MRELPLDKKRFRRPERVFAVGLTNMQTGQICYLEKGKCNMSAAIRASATVPFVSRPVVIGGVPYLDGGCSEKIPFSWAMQRGEKKIVVVKTRERAFRRKEEPDKLSGIVYRGYPKFVEAYQSANRRFNELNDRLEAMEKDGEVFVIAPSKPVEVTRFESDVEKLGELYWLGYHDMEAHLEDLRSYLHDSGTSDFK